MPATLEEFEKYKKSVKDTTDKITTLMQNGEYNEGYELQESLINDFVEWVAKNYKSGVGDIARMIDEVK